VAVTGTNDKNHEQVPALDKRQLAQVPAIMEQQIECPQAMDTRRRQTLWATFFGAEPATEASDHLS